MATCVPSTVWGPRFAFRFSLSDLLLSDPSDSPISSKHRRWQVTIHRCEPDPLRPSPPRPETERQTLRPVPNRQSGPDGTYLLSTGSTCNWEVLACNDARSVERGVLKTDWQLGEVFQTTKLPFQNPKDSVQRLNGFDCGRRKTFGSEPRSVNDHRDVEMWFRTGFSMSLPVDELSRDMHPA